MKKVRNVINYIILLLVIILFFVVNWLLTDFANVSIDEILFQLFVPFVGTESSIINSVIIKIVLPTIIMFIGLFGFIKIMLHYFNKNSILIEWRMFKKNYSIKIVKKFILWMLNIVAIILSIFIVNKKLNSIGLFEYINDLKNESTFIEDNYVDPRDVNMVFPEKKRNLIYIFVESLEPTYFSKELGGAEEYNLMPELEKLVNENISFSRTDKMGGALSVVGTTWTSAALVAHTSGIPLKIPSLTSNTKKLSKMVSGAYSIGNILENEGYNQMFFIGSSASFGNRGVYFESHGNYEIYQYKTALDNGKIPEGYYVWWGVEDSKLFEFAKEEITKLASKDEPFNFTTLTTNTHHIGGYLDEGCESKYDDKYANVIACTSKQVNEFVNWIKEQDFYENTTIVIAGDHLSMDPNHFKNFKGYRRTIFNVFINSAITTDNTKNRDFATIDMFPSTLASMGVTFDGSRIALGTNLFSGEKTLIEEYGLSKVNAEFKSKSNFYNKTFLYK